MRNFPLALVTVFFIGLGALPAEDRPQIELKNKSSFQMEGNARNPFWPIGFKPSASVARGGSAGGLDIPLSSFLLTSITLDQGARFAIINGKSMPEGQQFTMHVGSQVYQLKVKSIEDGHVILTNEDREILVPLRRK